MKAPSARRKPAHAGSRTDAVLQGFGPKSTAALASIGIRSIGDLRRRDPHDVYAALKARVPGTSMNFLHGIIATFRLQPASILQVVLHTGATAKAAPRAFSVDDPAGLLRWAAPDRCIVAFESVADARSKAKQFEAVLRAWIAQL